MAQILILIWCGQNLFVRGSHANMIRVVGYLPFIKDAAPTELVKTFGRWFYRYFAPPGLWAAWIRYC